MDEPLKSYPPSASRLSKTPSWVMLGFLLGALFVWALPKVEQSVSPPAPPTAVLRLERPKTTDIEAVFAEWGRYAAWDNDLTEVVLWDVEKKSYSICYEVLRSGERLYFRSIPSLTRPLLTHGVPDTGPLRFTETEAMRREWLRQADLQALRPAPGRP